MKKIAQNVIDQILGRVGIVDIIGEHTRLKKAGANHMGLCPFHGDKDPSFSVNEDKGVWYCFGCRKGGNLIGFVMDIEGLAFNEAVEKLARRAGVQIEEEDEEQARRRQERDLKLGILDHAARWYNAILTRSKYGEPFRRYLEGRGVAADIQSRFLLGASLPAWDTLIKEAAKRGFPVDALEHAGLVVAKEDGRAYDRFRNRLMFPIHDLRGRVVGFGARGLEADAQPKYLNSPQSDFFDKGRLLYGLHQARQAIRESGQVALVEGYMDVLAMHQFGFSNAVATMGTALTEDQVALLRRYTDKAILAFDADSAGNEAAARSVEALLGQGMFVYVLRTPEGKDPDEFLRKDGGAERMEELLASPLSYFDFHLDLLRARYGDRTPEARVRVAKAMIPIINHSSDPLIRDAQFKALAAQLDLEERRLRAAAGSSRSRPRREPAPEPGAGPSPGAAAQGLGLGLTGAGLAERQIIRALLEVPERIERVGPRLRVEDFQALELGRLFEFMLEVHGRDGAEGLAAVIQSADPVRDDEINTTMAMLLNDESIKPIIKEEGRAGELLDDLLRTMERRNVEKEIEKLKMMRKEAELRGDNEKRDWALAELQKIRMKPR